MPPQRATISRDEILLWSPDLRRQKSNQFVLKISLASVGALCNVHVPFSSFEWNSAATVKRFPRKMRTINYSIYARLRVIHHLCIEMCTKYREYRRFGNRSCHRR